MDTTGGCPVVVFCGERHILDPEVPFTIGRAADLSVDDSNLHIHRRFLLLSHERGLWWIANVGSSLSATLTSRSQPVQAWLGPEVRLPLVFADTLVHFSAGSTTYEIELEMPDAVFTGSVTPPDDDVTRTIGRVELVVEQKQMVVALAEPALREGRGPTLRLPTNAEAARRLGWGLKKFERKLDAVCEKLTRSGIRGFHGAADRLASDRRSRLVEYALAVRLVTADDLPLLDIRNLGTGDV